MHAEKSKMVFWLNREIRVGFFHRRTERRTARDRDKDSDPFTAARSRSGTSG
jgi:hypothetical protein